jgi:serine/threonine protein phosphatase PrpC
MTEPLAATPAPTRVRCPSCGAGVTDGEHFCETCGAPLPGADETVRPPAAVDAAVVRTRPGSATGAPLSPRDHYLEQPAAWVAACCDRGLRHPGNEDATAVSAEPAPGSRAVLVVCDGVSTSTDSDVAALAGARAARDLLTAARPTGAATLPARAATLVQAMAQAAAQANAAVIANTAPESANAASCTFAAAVIEGHLVVHGNLGDSRVYWLPDAGAGDPLQLSTDDSVAQARMEMGVARQEAENGPQAHAITKWLGRESQDVAPRTGSVEVSVPGWLLVCSDGLWNYCSAATDLQALVAELAAGTGSDPLRLAVALVDWANGQGGRDNISVALARHG